MRPFEFKSQFANRETVATILILLAVRSYQLIDLNRQSFESVGSGLSECYSIVTHISLAVFVLVPLFAIYMLPSFKALTNSNYCIRITNRECFVYRFLLLAVAKSIMYAVLVNLTAVVIMLANCPFEFKLVDVVTIALVSCALEVLFFLVCASLMLVTYILTWRIQIAMISVLCYAIWDFAVIQTPFLPDQILLGWSLTQMNFPIPISSFLAHLAALMATSAILTGISLVRIRARDMIDKSEGEDHV